MPLEQQTATRGGPGGSKRPRRLRRWRAPCGAPAPAEPTRRQGDAPLRARGHNGGAKAMGSQRKGQRRQDSFSPAQLAMNVTLRKGCLLLSAGPRLRRGPSSSCCARTSAGVATNCVISESRHARQHQTIECRGLTYFTALLRKTALHSIADHPGSHHSAPWSYATCRLKQGSITTSHVYFRHLPSI